MQTHQHNPKETAAETAPANGAKATRNPLQMMALAAQEPVQKKQENHTGLPDNLKTGVENLSGYAMDDVKVHYNSAKPAGLNALAYAQGTEIHLGPGQEKHLPHEAWHVVQQKQGRVQPTMQLKGSVPVNDDQGLEREADAMGERARGLTPPAPVRQPPWRSISLPISPLVQRQIGKNGDGKLVLDTKTNIVYRAQRDKDGYYWLEKHDAEGVLKREIRVAGTDKRYRLLQENEQPQLSVRSDQKNRRVYSQLPWADKPEQFTALHKQSGGKLQADFSYTHMSNALHTALDNEELADEDIDNAITAGAERPLTDGPLKLKPGLDQDLQLIPLHLLKYQEFHTPPTLKSNKRKRENPWRQEELDLTREWMQLPGAAGMRKILPKLESEGEEFSQLRNIYPGPVDVGFPPNTHKTLFSYEHNKGIYLLNRKMLLQAHFERQKIEKPEERETKRRRILTEAYVDTIVGQDNSTAKDEKYLQTTMGLKRLESQNSFDMEESSDGEDRDYREELINWEDYYALEDTSDEDDPDYLEDTGNAEDLEQAMDEEYSVDPEDSIDIEIEGIYDDEDSLIDAHHKHNTFLLALGTQVKLLNRKLLQDEQEIVHAKQQIGKLNTPAPKRSPGRKNNSGAVQQAQERLRKAEASKQKHEKMLDKLEARHKRIFDVAKDKFDETSTLYKNYTAKKKLLEKLPAKEGSKISADDETLKHYKRALNASATLIPIKELRKDKKSFLSGVGEKKLEGAIGSSRKSRAEARNEWAAQYGGVAQYGNSNGNNCLIYAIAYAIGYNIPLDTVTAIREALVRSNLVGVNANGFLPGYPWVIDPIAQHVLGELLAMGRQIEDVSIRIDSVLPGIQPVLAGSTNANAKKVHIFHDSVHYWWLKK
jgi:hypothetical protein